MKTKVLEVLNELIEENRNYDIETTDKLTFIKESITKIYMDNSNLIKAYPIKNNMRYQKNIGYFIKFDDDIEDGPYCPLCWESKGKLIHLKTELCKYWDEIKLKNDLRYADYYRCLDAKCDYWNYDYDISSEIREMLDKKKRNIKK